jgi:hypothetical protein
MRKPNYRFERAERDRVKQAKKDEKAKRRQERPAHEDIDEPDQLAPPTPSNDGP